MHSNRNPWPKYLLALCLLRWPTKEADFTSKDASDINIWLQVLGYSTSKGCSILLHREKWLLCFPNPLSVSYRSMCCEELSTASQESTGCELPKKVKGTGLVFQLNSLLHSAVENSWSLKSRNQKIFKVPSCHIPSQLPTISILLLSEPKVAVLLISVV